jgi:predicted dehydrogenase
MSRPQDPNRRQFLGQATAAAAATVAAPYIIPASALGRDGAVAANSRIVMGAVGTGGQGRGNLGAFMNNNDVQFVAVCDVETAHRNLARDMVNKKYGTSDCAAYNNFEELVTRKDIDAVSVATPDHWHALASIAALNNGKDVYCEKPLANSVGEGRAICDAVKRNSRILQTGSHERSGPNARFACELVRSGRLGKLHTIRINLPCSDDHHRKAMAVTTRPAEVPVPPGFDYDRWLGHTAKAPYTPLRCHFWWRFILAYGGGEMTDRGAHVIDLAQLGAGTDDTGPVEIKARGTQSKTGLYDAFMDYQFEDKFAGGLRMIGSTANPRGLKFEGTDGWIFIHVHGAKLEADPASLLTSKIGEKDVHLGRSPGHHRNFLDCVKNRQTPVASAEIGHRTASICHLNNIAMLTGRDLVWDPQKEQITNDAEANALLTPKMRAPWHL